VVTQPKCQAVSGGRKKKDLEFESRQLPVNFSGPYIILLSGLCIRKEDVPPINDLAISIPIRVGSDAISKKEEEDQ